MSYKVKMFKADQNPELCMEYSRNQSVVLSEYGSGRFSVSREKWMDNPGAYLMVAYNTKGEMVSGLRMQLHHEAFPLQIESVIDGLGKIMETFRSEPDYITAEICAMWTAREVRQQGFDLILSQAATAMAARFGITSLFSLASYKTNAMFSSLGFMSVESRDRESGFMYPTGGYVSTVMVAPELDTMQHADEAHKLQMLALRNNPSQTITGGTTNDMLIQYQLDEVFEMSDKQAEKYLQAA